MILTYRGQSLYALFHLGIWMLLKLRDHYWNYISWWKRVGKYLIKVWNYNTNNSSSYYTNNSSYYSFMIKVNSKWK